MTYCGIKKCPYADSDNKAATADFRTGEIMPGKRLDDWRKWQCTLGIFVGVNSRNPDNIRVERTEILNVNDSMIDVYFEFTRHYSYAWPFRLASVDITRQLHS